MRRLGGGLNSDETRKERDGYLALESFFREEALYNIA